jgi:hypothetical protein
MLTLLQIASIVVVAAYLGYSRADARRRNARSWDSLLTRLRPEWSARELIDPNETSEDFSPTPDEKWNRIRGAHGLWAMYENAGVMLEMANYATQNSGSVDHDLLAALRSDSMQIRVCVLTTFARYALSEVNDGLCTNVLQAESAYAEMVLRMTEFLQVSARDIAPKFEAAL